MKMKTWQDHKEEMNNDDAKESSIIIFMCVIAFAIMFGVVFLF